MFLCDWGVNCIQANSNECDRPAKTDFRLGKHEKLDKSELCHAGNRTEVSRHSTAKLNKMKTDFLLQHLKVHEGIQHQWDKCSYKTPTKKYLKGPINRHTIMNYFLV